MSLMINSIRFQEFITLELTLLGNNKITKKNQTLNLNAKIKTFSVKKSPNYNKNQLALWLHKIIKILSTFKLILSHQSTTQLRSSNSVAFLNSPTYQSLFQDIKIETR